MKRIIAFIGFLFSFLLSSCPGCPEAVTPTNFMLSINQNREAVCVQWDVIDGLGYQIFKGETTDNMVNIYDSYLNYRDTPFYDDDVTPGKTYFYKVRSLSCGDKSDFSEIKSITIPILGINKSTNITTNEIIHLYLQNDFHWYKIQLNGNTTYRFYLFDHDINTSYANAYTEIFDNTNIIEQWNATIFYTDSQNNHYAIFNITDTNRYYIRIRHFINDPSNNYGDVYFIITNN